MYAVGRLISTVSGPFHPFGGAVDVVVVEQPDGSFKSSPWYVRFGKFQGVLKTREKVVSICVNGVDAAFHMYLDHTGEAYFLEEVEEEVEEEVALESSLPGELKDEQLSSQKPLKSLSCNFDAAGSPLLSLDSVASGSGSDVTRTGSKRARLLGLVFGRRLSQGEPSPDIGRANSLERAEIAADLLDSNWSTELALEKHKSNKTSHLSTNSLLSEDLNPDGDGDRLAVAETVTVSTTMDGSVFQESSERISEFLQDFGSLQIEGKVRDLEQRNGAVHLSSDSDRPIHGSVEKLSDMNSRQESTTTVVEKSVKTWQVPQSNGSAPLMESKEDNYSSSQRNLSHSFLRVGDIAEYKEETSTVEESFILKVKTDRQSISVEDVGLTNSYAISDSRDAIHQSEVEYQNSNGKIIEDEQFLFSDDEFKPAEDQKTSSSASSSVGKEMDSLIAVDDTDSRGAADKHLILFTSFEKGCQEDAQKKFEDLLEKRQQKMSFPLDIHGFHDANTELDRMVESLPNMWGQIDSLEADHQPSRSFDASTTSPRWLDLRNNVFSHRNLHDDMEADLDKGQPTVTDDAPSQTPKSETPKSEAQKSDSVSSGVGDPSKTIVVPSGTWRLWPFSFQRATSSKSSTSSINPSSEITTPRPIESTSPTDENKPDVKRKVFKKKMMRTITPTSAQLESLTLKEGRNMVTFAFSTAMLGKQQVDARIYLWKWNARVVISDVDGTITKSDVLGQFMPMVGYDWSHIGVAHLFSAIKENGYQFLFLSARSISQSYLTRQFLFNLKQDGKALPDGPVVISPDGLFPSLYREVIRRAPHEFKIACLEDIRALFPSDCNPFYAGFGNRDTDEISYLKVGIPKGKIFIINPKGEVAVHHRRVDAISYSDLHTLVNGMFPPASSSEQEDFNSWNFWKLSPRMDNEF
uniref:LNS2/PITP domain-containing protein n=1 Tax=Kalanchoe fedtschenkoi TaxID=63787 RepID=A0A7N0TPZ2_KALFE